MESARLNLDEHIVVPVELARLWSLISDPDSVVSCMPGAELTGANEDGTLNGTIVMKLGPTKVSFQGTVLPEFDHDHHTGSLQARGADARGRTKASATVSFRLDSVDDAEAAATELGIDSIIDVSGGLAPFVRSGGQHLVRRMLEEFSANIAELASAQQPGDDTEPAGTAQPADRGGATATRPRPSEPIRGFSLLARTLLDMVRAALRRLTRRGTRPAETDDRRAP